MAQFQINRAALDRLTTHPAVMRGLIRAGEQVRTEAQAILARHHDTGQVSRSLQVQASTRAPVVYVFSDEPQAPHIHRGTGPAVGRSPYFPPISRLRPWAIRHQMNVYAVQQQIYKHGTQPIPFLSDALKRVFR